MNKMFESFNEKGAKMKKLQFIKQDDKTVSEIVNLQIQSKENCPNNETKT